MSRFVLLEHHWNGVHYDLMIEQSSSLATWKLNTPLEVGRQQVIRLPDHRLHYLDYEGPVSGNRGTVTRMMSGECNVEKPDERTWHISVAGKYNIVLQHTQDDAWLMVVASLD